MLRVLYVQPGRGIGGAKVSLYHLLRSTSPSQTSHVALSAPVDQEYPGMLNGHVEKVHQLWLPGWIRPTNRDMKHRFLRTLSMLRRGWYLAPSLQLAKLIRQERIDLVHTNSIVTPVGAVAAYLTRRPHIWHVRESLSSQNTFPLALGDSWSARIFDTLSQAIICNSDYTARFFRSHGIEPEVIFNGIDLSHFIGSQKRGELLKAELGLAKDCPVIAIVASIRADCKEHDLFLHAVAKLKERHPECQFIIFGGSTDLNVTPYTRSLRDLASGLDLDGKLVWAGFIDDVPAIMHSFDIMIHPTSKEGSGRVVMEAMAAGKPVVGVRSGGVQELIQDDMTGYLVPPHNANALSEAANRMLNQPSLRKQMGAQAQTYAQKHFSHDRTAAAVQKLYTRVMAQHRS